MASKIAMTLTLMSALSGVYVKIIAQFPSVASVKWSTLHHFGTVDILAVRSGKKGLDIIPCDVFQWNRPENKETLQALTLGNGQMCVTGRGTFQIYWFCYSSLNAWAEQTAGLGLFADRDGWNQPAHYLTLKTVAIKGGLAMVGRNASGLHASTFFFQKGWGKQSSSSIFVEAFWNLSEHYKTIRVVSNGEHVFIFGRGPDAIYLLKYDPLTQTWTQFPSFAYMMNSGGWNNSMYYETIQVVVQNSKIVVFGRGYSRTHTVSFDLNKQQWVYEGEAQYFTHFQHWNNPQCYRTIKAVVMDDKLYVVGNSGNQLHIAVYDFSTQLWHAHQVDSMLTAADGWDQPDHYLTIRAVVAEGRLYVVGMKPNGTIYSGEISLPLPRPILLEKISQFFSYVPDVVWNVLKSLFQN